MHIGEVIDRVFLPETGTVALLRPRGKESAHDRVFRDRAIRRPKLRIQIEIHQQFAEIKQGYRRISANPPPRLCFPDQLRHRFEVGLGQGFFVELRQGKPEVDTEQFAQRQVGKNLLAGVGDGVVVGPVLGIQPPTRDAHRNQQQRCEPALVTGRALEPFEEAKGHVADVGARLLDRGLRAVP